MSPYFHARWYVDANGLLQRRTPEDQERVERQQQENGTWEPADAAHWSPKR